MRAREASSVQTKPTNYVPPEYFPNGKRSLAGIGLRAFLLGNAAVFGFFFAAQLAYHSSHLWRPFLFLGTLSVFHFLEFYTTAAYNTPDAKISSFLLTNGAQYQIAHSVALFETIFTSYFLPGWQSKVHSPLLILAGISMVLVGQVVRSTAMAQAGTNFNHQVQSKKNDGHELVTRGLYAYFRHPSYFGFFWWGIGTQLMIGNAVCTLGYAGVLWYFFMKRITRTYAFAFLARALLTREQTRRNTSFSFSAKTTRHIERTRVCGYRLFEVASLLQWGGREDLHMVRRTVHHAAVSEEACEKSGFQGKGVRLGGTCNSTRIYRLPGLLAASVVNFLLSNYN
jgi:protein-S-isoprenylcysteine O-methyltransferase